MTAKPPAGYRAGVGILLIRDPRRVFVARRIDLSDAWQMPQGGIDKGETPRAAAFREMAEEIGTANAEVLAESRQWLTYDLPPEAFKRSHRGFTGQAQKWFAMRFLGRDAEIDVATAHPEFDAWKWVAPAEVLRLIVPFKRPVYEAVLAEFRSLLEG